MEQWERNTGDLNLDDILKEFGSSQPQEDAPQVIPEPEEKPEQEEKEDVRVWDGNPVPQENVPPAMPQDTVRLNDITKEIKKQKSVSDATIAFTPVNQPEEPPTPVYIPAQEPKTEPYSDRWEPEYEDPMGEYVPPEPIVFRPKSRLHELKKKLVSGPEKRYYQLTERGFGKLQAAIFLCGLVALLSAATAVLDVMGLIPQERMRLLVFGQLLGLLLSAMLGSYQLMEGFGDLIKRRFSLNTLLLFSLIACIADGILCLSAVRVPCCAPFSLNMTMSLWAAYHNRITELRQMDTMRRATRLDSVVLEPDYFEGKSGILRGEGQVEDFMETYRTTPRPQRLINTYALIALFASLGVGITAGVLVNISTGLRFFSASLLVAAPATSFISISRPSAVLERRLHKLGAVLCGWDGVSALNTKLAVPLDSEDLFPSGTVKMNGLKFFGSRNPDQVVAYTAAVMTANGGGLAPLFSQLLESRNGYHFDVETMRHYPNGGVGGVVNSEAVLVGSRSFMKEMGIEIPEGAKISQAVYSAIDGVLNGVFAITYTKTKPASVGLATLGDYRHITPVMISNDFMLSEQFVAGKFGVKTRRMHFPERKTRDALSSHRAGEEGQTVALTTQEGLAGMACAVTGARNLRSACVTGVIIQMVGGILGLLIMLALSVVHAEYLLTPENLLLYELVWMIPGMLITEWTASL